MAGDSANTAARVHVHSDARSATLTLGGSDQAAPIDARDALKAIRDAGLKPLSHWSEPLAIGLSQHRRDPAQPVEVSLHGIEPVPGRDARVQWLPNIDPAAASRQDVPAAHPDHVDFYNISAFVFVQQGQTLGQIIPPTPPVPGRDVFGREIPADNPQPATIEIGSGVEQTTDSDGRTNLLAAIDGVLHHEHDLVRVEPVLQISGDVDFRTGNIDFPGDVMIAGTVRDLFTVRAKGDIVIGGMVEAAALHATGNLTIQGGFAGKEKGRINVDGDVNARYLSGVTGRIGGTLRVQREIDHSQLTILGPLDAPQGRLAGSTVSVGDDSQVGDLGSPIGQNTHIRLGYDPQLERKRAQLTRLRARLKRSFTHASDLHERLTEIPPAQRSTAQDRWLARMTRRRTVLAQREQRCQRIAATLDQQHRRLSRVELHVQTQLHAGTHLATPNASVVVNCPHPGPLTLGQAEGGYVGLRRSGRTAWEPLASATPAHRQPSEPRPVAG